MASNKGTNSSWVKAFGELAKERGNPPPSKEWKTARQLMEELNMGENRIRLILRDGVEQKKIEVHHGSEMGVHGKLVRKIWYKLK